MLYYQIIILVYLVSVFIWREFWNEIDNHIVTYSTNISNPVWWISYIMLICFPFFVIAAYGIAMLSINS